jgi:hypothetical protein
MENSYRELYEIKMKIILFSFIISLTSAQEKRIIISMKDEAQEIRPPSPESSLSKKDESMKNEINASEINASEINASEINASEIAPTEIQPVSPKAKKNSKKAAAPIVEAQEAAPIPPTAEEILQAMSSLTNPMPADEWEASYNEAMENGDTLMVEALTRIGILEAPKPVEESKNARKNNTDGKALTLRIRQEVLKAHIAGHDPNMKAVVAFLFDEFGDLNDSTVKTVFNHAIATIRAIDSLGLKIEGTLLIS